MEKTQETSKEKVLAILIPLKEMAKNPVKFLEKEIIQVAKEKTRLSSRKNQMKKQMPPQRLIVRTGKAKPTITVTIKNTGAKMAPASTQKTKARPIHPVPSQRPEARHLLLTSKHHEKTRNRRRAS